MNNKLKTAFTLIELLVVIAIIGILSGLIIVGMSSTTQSANIAKAQIFSSSLRNSLLINLISEWKFDGAAYTQDTWGTNHCTIGGAPSVYSESNCIYGSCLKFNGSPDYLGCGTASNLDVSNAITVEAWIKVIAFGTNEYRGIIGRLSGAITDGCGYQYGLSTGWVAGNYLEFWAHKEGSSDCNGLAAITSNIISLNKWYHVVGTYNSTTGDQKLYLNGILDSFDNKGVGVKIRSFPAEPTEIGRSPQGIWNFNGLIDGVRVYNAAIPASQIKEIYYAGINRLLAKEKINKEEYLSEISSL